MHEIEIMTTDCPRVLCDPPPGGAMTTINTNTGHARCHACDTTWFYSWNEIDEILKGLDD